MKCLLVSDHASCKVLERQIGLPEVPDLKDISKNGIHKVVKKVGDRELVAFYRIGPEVIVLMTAYWRKK